jgi:hypothetical protein
VSGAIPGAVVVTTIQAPTASVLALASVARAAGLPLIAVGDRATPAVPWPAGAELLGIGAQLASGGRLARLLPENHYARKNLGYLAAVERAAPRIFDTDDDNAPLPAWAPRAARVQARACAAEGWVNVYRLFSGGEIWPRGYPLEEVRRSLGAAPELGAADWVEAPVQQGLVNGSPDVDAVWRLLGDRPFAFDDAPSVALAPGAWCPFNSQSTWWFPAAFPLLYLPSHVSFRMTDIWRSFVAQRCLWELGLGVVFHGPEMVQARNPHRLLRDFEQEVPGYLGNAAICALLERTELVGGAGAVAGNLGRCYEALAGAGFVPAAEMPLVDAWLDDLEAAGRRARAVLGAAR